MSMLRRRQALTVSALGIGAVTIGAIIFLVTSKTASGQGINPVKTVSDVSSCPITTVTISRSPFVVREQRQIPDGSSVVTLNGVFASVPAGTTFHVTHVNAMFFTKGPEVGQVRLYQNGDIVEAFNVGGPSLDTSGGINSQTMNQPVDLYFQMSNDTGAYDLQLIRSSKNGLSTAIAEFWGYLTVDTCPVRQ